MTKTLYIISLLLTLLLAACGSHEVVDAESEAEGQTPIAFGTDGSVTTRTSVTEGSAAADALGRRMVVYGTKTLAGDEVQVVFPGYEVRYAASSAHTTQTNTDGWEYVGQGSSAQAQSIKYWDWSANHYAFFAYSLGEATASTVPTVTTDAQGRPQSITIAGTADYLQQCHFTDICKVEPEAYGQTVKLPFTPYVCKVRIGFYEMLQDAAVSDMKFTVGGAEPATDHVVACTSYVTGGNCTLKYSYNPYGVVTQIIPGAGQTAPTADFGAIHYAEGGVLGTTSMSASFAHGGGEAADYYLTFLPYETRTEEMTLTCSYTVTPPGGEWGKVENITAIVPQEYMHWHPGYEYTYIFKVTEGAVVLDTSIDIEGKIQLWQSVPTDNGTDGKGTHSW